jgi:hypothetical protein
MTTATCRTANAGNLAIQTEIFTLTVADAKSVLKQWEAWGGKITEGSYWHANFVRPLRTAIYRRVATVTIFAAGFSSGEFANILRCAGLEVEYLA